MLSTQVARPLVEIFFGRLDARTVGSRTTGELIERFFPGRYELLEPGAEPDAEPWWPGGAAGRMAGRCGSSSAPSEERGALRLFLRALRRLPLDAGLGGGGLAARLAARCASRSACATASASSAPADASPESLIAAADIVCAASGGPRPRPGSSARRSPRGAVPVASDIPLYAGAARRRRAGPAVPAGRRDHARRPARAADRRAPRCARELARRGRGGAVRDWARGRRRGRGGSTARSPPAATTPTAIPGSARRIAAAALDPRRPAHAHRPLLRLRDAGRDPARDGRASAASGRSRSPTTTRSPGRSPRARSPTSSGIKVIVAEEVKTAEQGEVIGLFVEEKIERGMTMAETIAEIRRQGGLVYVPAPVRPPALGPRLRAPARDGRGDRHPRGLQPPGRADRVQRGGRALRRQVPDRPRRRLGQPRRAGPRQRDDPRPRLRRPGGVPRGDARRRHRPQAQEPRLRAGAQVAADRRRAAAVGGAAPAGRRRASADAGAAAGRRRGRRRQRDGRLGRSPRRAGKPDADDRRRDPGEVPRARDPRAQPAHPSTSRTARTARAAT